MSASAPPPTQPRVYLPYTSNSHHDTHYIPGIFLPLAHSRRDYRIWQGAISSCIFVVSCERPAYVLLLQVQQGGRCHRTVRYLCEDDTIDSRW